MDPKKSPYIPPPITPENQDSQQNQPQRNSSHVTAAPDSSNGQNYNPRIRSQYANEPSVVHEARSTDGQPFTINEDLKSLHEESKKHHPSLNLSIGEFVILDIKRHPIGMFAPVFSGGLVLLLLVGVLVVYPSDAENYGLPGYGLAMMIVSLLMVLIGIGTYISIWIYLQNQFYLTNESVIQEIQTSLFSRREQMVSLGSIEDASFRQSGILQTMLGYGTIRLSTEGDETTYRFSYVSRPRNQISTVNNAIEAFKNGRPFDLNSDVRH